MQPPETKRAFREPEEIAEWIREVRSDSFVRMQPGEAYPPQKSFVVFHYETDTFYGRIVFVKHWNDEWRQVRYGSIYGEQYEIPRIPNR